MKKLYTILIIGIFACKLSKAQDNAQLQIDSLEKKFTYQHGTIKLGNGVGSITVPPGFKYLDSVQALKVLTVLWNNPKTENMTLGFILPEKQGILTTGGYVFNIQYDAIGYVKDDDANDINYDELLTNLKKETADENDERTKEGYQPIEVVGWAAKPYYDANRHILHWAKEVKFGADSVNTLNYNVRVLGRKGVLVLNAIATMQEVNAVKAGVPHVLNVVNFADGYKYTDFDSGVDKVAAWTIGGLVAGKILAKVGFFALLLKFWKLIMLAFVAVGSFFRKLFKGRKKEEPVFVPEPAPANENTAWVASETADKPLNELADVEEEKK
ncbi:DUF2167 domain-containing protein [Mucilaginibacter achroorhodeus]|uniref:DUF2167 domain-containing protein n=1 Tax=Mucilaginibacter achroorhodeus TaxID=2599294 RepID=A0A563U721_9SPHI|nr:MULTISPECIES: DUF2167 domain-containing protein [Mucilaginibacter]QXV65001.1 DUF2167 domain-containing protein [Mucilaginibacter sp. 21P]TWR27152.1 DUF2167 domain-containing protein [Mucilaginibacter achroorhodeus]